MTHETFHNCQNEKNNQVITDSFNGEVLCGDCGVVLMDKIIDNSENASYHSPDEYFSKKRTGPSFKISRTNQGNSSLIAKKNVDASGNSISFKNKAHFSRLRLWDSRSRNNSKERNLVQAFTMLDSITNKLGLPENAKEQAASIYRKASENNIIRGNSTSTMISASTYAACRQLGIPRSLDDISQSANIQRRQLSRTYRHLIRKLNLEINSANVDFVSKVANLVSVDEKTKRLSSKIIDDLKKEDLHVGKNPVGLAAGAVYLSAIGSGNNVSLAQISKKTKISTVTIRKVVNLLRPFAANYIKTIAMGS